MKKLLAVSVATLFLVGCTVESDTVKTPETFAPVETTPPTGVDAYINNVLDAYPHLLNNLGKPWVIEFAENICEEIDRGSTLADFANLATQYDIDPSMLGFLIGEAIRNFCPSNQWFIDAAGRN